MARTVEDILARRLRALFLNSHAAIQSAPTVAALMARELGYDQAWIKSQILDFSVIAQSYCVNLETVKK